MLRTANNETGLDGLYLLHFMLTFIMFITSKKNLYNNIFIVVLEK